MSNLKAKKINLEKLIIKDDIEIKSEDENKFYGQEIKLFANIRCSGKLLLDHCVLIYNPDEIKGKIILSDKAVLTISHCTVIGKRNNVSLDYSEDYLIEGDGENVVIENTLFYNCRFFASLYTPSLLYSQWSRTKISIENCIIRYSKSSSTSNFINTSGLSNEMTNCHIENFDLRKKTDNDPSNTTDNMVKNSTHYIFKGITNVSMCTFKNITGCLYYHFDLYSGCLINCCNFIQCDKVVYCYGSAEITNCVFEKSENVVNSGSGKLEIKSSQFVGCKNNLVYVDNSNAEIKNCDIYNYKGLKKPAFSFSYSKEELNSGELSFCTFNGVTIADSSEIIKVILVGKYPGYQYLTIKKCNFLHCVTKASDKKLININAFSRELFGKIKEVEVTEIYECSGLDRVTKKTLFNLGKSGKIKINRKTLTGESIGNSLDKSNVGLYGFDARKF